MPEYSQYIENLHRKLDEQNRTGNTTGFNETARTLTAELIRWGKASKPLKPTRSTNLFEKARLLTARMLSSP